MGTGDTPGGGRRSSGQTTEQASERHTRQRDGLDSDAVERTVRELFGDRSGRDVRSVETEPSFVGQLLEALAEESMTVEERIALQEALRTVMVDDLTDDRIDAVERLLDAVTTAQGSLQRDLDALAVRVDRLERIVDEGDA